MSFQWVFPPSSIIRFITNINNILTLKERYNFHMHPKNYFETRILQILLLSYLESRGPIVRLWNGGIAIDRLGVETIGGGGAVIRAVDTLFVEEKWRGGGRYPTAHCLLREKSKKPQLWARLRGSTWLLASIKSRPLEPSQRGEREGNENERARPAPE